MEPVRPAPLVPPVQPHHAVEGQTPSGATERVEGANERERERKSAKRRARDKKEAEKDDESKPEGPLGKKVDIRA